MKQEQIIQIQMLEQEASQLNEQLNLVEQNINEMTELKVSLDEIDNVKKGEEMRIDIGKKIYLPVEVKSKDLIVEVGKGNFVKKNIKDTKEVIELQVKRLRSGKEQIMSRLEELQMEMQNLIFDIEKEQRKGDKNEDNKG